MKTHIYFVLTITSAILAAPVRGVPRGDVDCSMPDATSLHQCADFSKRGKVAVTDIINRQEDGLEEPPSDPTDETRKADRGKKRGVVIPDIEQAEPNKIFPGAGIVAKRDENDPLFEAATGEILNDGAGDEGEPTEGDLIPGGGPSLLDPSLIGVKQ